MRNHQRYLTGKLAVLVTLALTLAQCVTNPIAHQQPPAQDAPRANASVALTSGSAFEGKAAGEALPFHAMSGNLKESILAHPAPEVWLNIPGPKRQESPDTPDNGKAPAIKVELPVEAKEALKSQWQEALVTFYYMDIEKEADAQKYANRMTSHVKFGQGTFHKLRDVLLEAPDGKRAITINEAWELIGFINASAHHIIEEAKEYKQ